MKDRKLATRYARALLAALPNASDQDIADSFLKALADGVSASAELRSFLLDPATSAGAKKSVLDQLASDRGVPDRVKTFLRLLADNGRLAQLPSISEVFRVEREAGQGTVSATLASAAPLSPELATRAAAALGKLTGRKVSLTIEVDPGLLGGAVAQIGSVVYDGSLKTQLARLRRVMGEE